MPVVGFSFTKPRTMVNSIATLVLNGTLVMSALFPVTPAQATEVTVMAPAPTIEQIIVTPKLKIAEKGKVVVVTAYTSEPRQTDDTPCIASDNTDICVRYAKGEKICAAGDYAIPMGAKLYVEGYGICTVADRMNIRYNGTGRVDIYLGQDTPAAFEWGKRKVEVKRV